MKICAVTTWPPHRDGVALYSAYLYKCMGEIAEVKVLANESNSSSFFRNGLGGKCRVVKCWRRGSFTYPFKIFRSVLRENPDIVHLQHGWLLYGDKISSLLFPVLLFFLRLLNKPIVVTMHTVVKRNAHLYNSKIVNFIAKIAIIFLTRTIVKLSSGIIVHNYLMKETLKNAYSLEKEEKKIFIIPHGVKKALGKPRKREDETIRILSLGFIRRGSGIEHLVEAFKSFSASYPNAVLVVAGGRHAHDGKGYIEVIRKVLSNPPKNVIFTNFVDEKELDQLIWKSKIIVLSAVEDYYIEASGSLARVAMYGKPIICSRVPKFEVELENRKDCIMVEPGNLDDLISALNLLASNASLRRKMGNNLKRKFMGREWSNVAKRHIKLFKVLEEAILGS